MNDKAVIEQYKNVKRDAEMMQTPPLNEAAAYLSGLIESALAKRKKLQNGASEQHTDPQPDDKSKSEGRIEFENIISESRPETATPTLTARKRIV